MAGLFSYLADEAARVVKRKALIIGLIAAGGLIALLAAGYAVDAVYVLLMFSYGPITGSLIVSGALAISGIVAIAAASVVSKR